MEFADIQLLVALLREANIPVCIVGELAFNYYNAPRVVHDLELCVGANYLELATSTFESQGDILERADEADYNIYTEYKRGYPRFRFKSPASSFYIVLFTDVYCHLNPLEEHIITPQEHQRRKECYSKEILDSFSADQIATLPLPRFASFFTGFCRTYIETLEVTAAIAAELLVDGMNIDEIWCRKNLQARGQSTELNFALRLVQGKDSRIADFTPNEVTCFIVDSLEATRVQKIPGFLKTLNSSCRDQPTEAVTDRKEDIVYADRVEEGSLGDASHNLQEYQEGPKI
ncbi:hypothetical protein FQN54_000896 [Arachnomyces sp. PD_36]|nr:hypothetical protein FQN54_000896 [Arachnomyces sp. PD_36]